MNAIKRVEEAIQEIKKGKMVIMLDDEDRENEGDLVYAATFSSDEHVNFMATHAKGLICVAVTKETAIRLELNPMVTSNTSSYETAFTVSVDCAKASTGISAGERNDTIKILGNPLSKTTELVKPGHIFPLIAKEGGVLVRTGHTEGSIDLCKLSGIQGESVICEIMKEDGTMARRDDLDKFAVKHNLKKIYISDLVEYRLKNETLISEISSKNDIFFKDNVVKKVFKDHLGNENIVILFGQVKEISYVKFHTIDSDINLFLNNKVDVMLEIISILQKNHGVLIFLSKESTYHSSEKNYGIGAQILKILKIKKLNLLRSTETHQYVGLHGFGLEIQKEIQI